MKLPDDIDFNTAAAMMLQGMTAQYLLRRTYKVKPGETIVVHAAAGGVGLIMCQWAKHLGATVIGVVSTPEKAELARAHGADARRRRPRRPPAEVKRITGGAMVPVVYDSVGKDTFMASLDCLAPLGMMVSYGNASGPVGAVDVGLLGAKGSLFLTRPGLATYTAKRADLEHAARRAVRRRRQGRGAHPGQPDLPAAGGRARARGPGGAADHRQHHPAALRRARSAAGGRAGEGAQTGHAACGLPPPACRTMLAGMTDSDAAARGGLAGGTPAALGPAERRRMRHHRADRRLRPVHAERGQHGHLHRPADHGPRLRRRAGAA